MKRSDIALVLVHLTAEARSACAQQILRAASAIRRPTIAIVTCDAAADARAAREFANDCRVILVCLPRDTEGLGRLIATASRFPIPTQDGIAHDSWPACSPWIRRVADKDATIALTGETGTGKTLLARHIHEKSPRNGRPFLVIDCGAVSAALVECELFGHVRGAFTGADRDRVGKFAAAADGTLVLDEINSLPLALQAKLLRAIEERVFESVGSNRPQALRARIIAISNVPLEQEIARERFRADLYHRINVFGFRLEPLRERRNDIVPFAHRFLAEHAMARAHGIVAISPDVLDALEAYHWPGNIRELRNVMERIAVLGVDAVVQLTDLPDVLQPVPKAASGDFRDGTPHGGPDSEGSRISAALGRNGNNRLRTAAELGISRVTLYKKLRKIGIGPTPRAARAPRGPTVSAAAS